MEEPDRPEISYSTCALHFWITKRDTHTHTNTHTKHTHAHTHTEYVILTTFSWQQWLRECASLLLVFIREFLVMLILSAIQ